eukprot:GILK01006129.1.p1 GENE.GILK01006129.1~~GILK01006129.1.p1  ORF type:complete len:121 (-),score=20.13 GILK01006129.1:91-453(-)
MEAFKKFFEGNGEKNCYQMCTDLFKGITTSKFTDNTYCKKGCGDDSDTIEECEENCHDLCYKDALKGEDGVEKAAWTKFLDRSPGDKDSSERCLKACHSGCAFKVQLEKAEGDSDEKKNE